MQCPAPPWVAACVAGSLDALYAQQTAPFLGVFQDHMRCMQQLRELQVRLAQLDKEGAELREENADLHRKLQGVDEARDRAAAAEAEAAKARVVQLEREVTQLYKDKSRLLEELVAAGGDLTVARRQVQVLEGQLTQSQTKVAELQSQLASTAAALTHERMSREAAAEEVAGAMAAKEQALQEAERLQAENAKLIKRLVELKENEVERMNQINKLHEEALQQATVLRREAAADKEAAEMIRARLMSGPLHHPLSASTAGPPQPQGGPLARGASAATVAQQATAGAPQATSFGGSAAGGATRGAGTPAGAADVSMGGRPGTGDSSGSSLASAGQSFIAGAADAWGTALGALSGLGMSPPASTASTAARAQDTSAGGADAGTAAAAAAAAAAGAHQVTLKETMGLPDAPDLLGSCQRVLPKAPFKSTVAHKGGCCSLASQHPGHLIASCGVNATVLLWNASTQHCAGLMAPQSSASSAGAASTLSGMTGTVNDVTFTCDGLQVLAAGSDKSLHLWDVASSQTRHTLTGHSAAVTGASAGPLDNRVAASCSEDRCIKVWDLSRGFCVRSLPCTKMPGCILMLKDGNTIASGHVDGTVCLWDVRQGRSGATQPALESRDHTQAICGLSPAYTDTVVLVASRDHTLTMWDYRSMSSNQILKGPGFTVGTVGSMGRGRCHVEMSVDGHFVAAGSGDGAVFVWDLSRPSTAGRGPPVPTVLRHHTEAVVAASWSSDVSVLATADKSGTVALWSLVG